MKSMLLVLKSNMYRKLTNNILVGIVISVCTIIMITGFSTLGGVSKAFDTMSESLNIPHLLITFPTQVYSAEDVYNWWMKYENTENVSEVRHTTEPRSVIINGEELKNYNDRLFLTVAESDAKTDVIKSNSGSDLKCPSNNCIWIPTGYANNHNVSIGDTIRIKKDDKYIDLKVEDIIIDSYYSSGFIQPTRSWVNQETYEDIKENELSAVSIRLTDVNKIDEAWKKFTEQYDSLFTGSMLDYSSIRFANLIMPSIICGILLFFSIIILFITLYVVSSIISMVIMTDYVAIGVLKSLGFTPRNIVFLYVFQYGGIGLIATLIGSAFSVFTSRLLINSFSATMGINIFSVSLVLYFILATFALIMVIILIAVYFCARKAGRIDAAQAIRFGRPKNKHNAKPNNNRLFSKVSSPPWLLAIRQSKIFMSKLFVIGVCFTTTIIVLVFSLNIYLSITNMSNQPAEWGFYDGDILLETEYESDDDRDDVVNRILEDSSVKEYSPLSEYIPATIPATKDKAAVNIMGTIFDGDMDVFGFTNIEGRNPKEASEISIGVNTAKKYNLSIGDSIKLVLFDKEVEYVVCGIYQSIADMGNGYRMRIEAIRKADENFNCSQYVLQLNDNSDKAIESFIQKYETTEGITISVMKENIIKNMGSVISGVSLGVAMMSIMFTVILLIILYNITTLCISNEKDVYGVVKVCGMIPTQIHKAVVYRTSVIFVISALIGLPLSIFATPKIMNAFMVSMGILRYPISFNILYSVIAILIMFGLIIITTLIPTYLYTKVSPRLLLME